MKYKFWLNSVNAGSSIVDRPVSPVDAYILIEICNVTKRLQQKTIFDINFWVYSPWRYLEQIDYPNWGTENVALYSPGGVSVGFSFLGQSVHQILYWVQYSEREVVGPWSDISHFYLWSDGSSLCRPLSTHRKKPQPPFALVLIQQ